VYILWIILIYVWVKFYYTEQIIFSSNFAIISSFSCVIQKGKKLHGLSPRANYTDRATAACRRTCAKFAERGCHVVSVTYPYGRILGFLDRSRYFFFQAAPKLYSRGRVDPVPDPLLLRKSATAGNRTWKLNTLPLCSQELWPLGQPQRRSTFFNITN
jgi:hypothetical protein